jgi:hypothetical protein
MKRQRQRFKNTLTFTTLFIVIAHVEEQGLLVVQVMIEFQFVVKLLESLLQ